MTAPTCCTLCGSLLWDLIGLLTGRLPLCEDCAFAIDLGRGVAP
jgi:hypothetical protein